MSAELPRWPGLVQVMFLNGLSQQHITCCWQLSALVVSISWSGIGLAIVSLANFLLIGREGWDTDCCGKLGVRVV